MQDFLLVAQIELELASVIILSQLVSGGVPVNAWRVRGAFYMAALAARGWWAEPGIVLGRYEALGIPFLRGSLMGSTRAIRGSP